MRLMSPITLVLLAFLAAPAFLSAQAEDWRPPEPEVPELAPIVGFTESEMREVVERYDEDRDALARRWDVRYSPERAERFRVFYEGWQDALDDLDYGALDGESRIDWQLLMNDIRYELALLDREERERAEMEPLLPFLDDVAETVQAWRRLEDVEPRRAAEDIVALTAEVRRAHETMADAVRAGEQPVSRVVALRAAGTLADLTDVLGDWHTFYDRYDPLFTWWVSEPWDRAEDAMEEYLVFLNEDLVGLTGSPDDPIIGDPIGAEGLAADLANEMIPYTPSELIAIAEQEFEWIEGEMRRAARDMGHGDDVMAALEEVKQRAVPAGEQPALIRMLAREAVAFLEARDLLTIPPLADEVWRWTMMTPERQRVAPFFLGGEVIRIAYPTADMAHADKLMSMRGNNPHFSRAVVHHELIPGHHLQGFMTSRYNPHRGVFSTPFWGEGWALYWEMRLWDLDFPSTPEDRMGMLFWRAHRAARIIFSLSFHLERMTPEEAIDFLVERVGHERANAEAEVRRSFLGSYSPLYQAAYMLGGLQFRALHEQLVESGQMTEREFHDMILQGGRTPVEMVKARLEGTLLPKDFESSWRFYGDPAR